MKANFYGLGYDPFVAAPELRGNISAQVNSCHLIGLALGRKYVSDNTKLPAGKGNSNTISALLSGSVQGHAGFGLGAFEAADMHDQLFATENSTLGFL